MSYENKNMTSIGEIFNYYTKQTNIIIVNIYNMSTNKMNTMTYFLLFFIVLVILYFYQLYKQKVDRETINHNYTLIQQYLLNDPEDIRLEKMNKPILWIYVDYQYNSRHWESFGSRSSYQLNQPYLYLTVKTIIEKCDQSFHICLIDEYSFAKLLPTWNIELNHISDPVKQSMIDLGMTKLLYRYGGLRVPPSFICMRNLIPLYDDMEIPFVTEMVNRNVTSDHLNFCPSIEFMGARKEDKLIGGLVEFMQRSISNDYTDQMQFEGRFDRWCQMKIEKRELILLDGQMIGTKTREGRQVLIDNLLKDEYIEFNKNMYGIYIPERELRNRTCYNWFVRMSPKQVLDGNMIVSKYILLANTTQQSGIIEPFKKRDNQFIGFWQVPSDAPVWGLIPSNLGNYVKKEKYPNTG